jgi:RNA-directed DNA polymerase
VLLVDSTPVECARSRETVKRGGHNVVLQGWINYYGRFYKSMLYPVFRHLNEILVRWAMRKYKRGSWCRCS